MSKTVESKDIYTRSETILHLANKSYQGPKDISKWEKYIKGVRELNEKLPNGLSKDRYNQRIDKIEALINVVNVDMGC